MQAPLVRTESSAIGARPQLAALGLGALLAVFGLSSLYGKDRQDPEAFALGAGTVSHFASADGAPIHCRDLRDAAMCLAAHARRGGLPVVLWLGNSQLHAVNEYRPGDETGALRVWRSLIHDGVDVLTFSQPNANLQEHWLLYTWVAERLPIRAVVLPLVFDDCRETGIRGSLAAALDDSAVKARLMRWDAGARILEGNRRRGAGGDFAALDGTLQQPVEAALVGWLDKRVPLWAERARTRTAIVLDLYRMRNAVLGIESSTVRRAIPGRQALNLAAADALLRDAAERGITTVVYLAPLRGDVRPRHVPSEYEAFRREAAALALRNHAHFADLAAAIPVAAWGSGLDEEGRESDVQHFGAEGHRVLADAVERMLRDAPADGS